MNSPAALMFTDNTEVIRFFVPGDPLGKGRPRSSSTGHMYTPAKTVAYESLVALTGHQAMAGRPPLLGPVDVAMRIWVKIAPSWPKTKQSAALAGTIFPASRPDADNVIKALFDGMNGTVWKDDVQVVSVHMSKRYSQVPGVDVTVLPAGALLTPSGILA